MTLQPLPHRRDDLWLVLRGVLRQLEGLRQGGIVGGEHLGFLRSHPPHEAIRPAVEVGILEGQLGFANAAQPAQYLGQHDGPRLPTTAVERLKKIAAPRKGGIARVRHIPDRRQREIAAMPHRTGATRWGH